MAATVAVLYPRQQYSTMPERYASWQAQSRLRHTADVTSFVYYHADDEAADVVADVDEAYVLVVVDPLVATSPDLAQKLLSEAESRGKPVVAQDGALYFCATTALADENRPLATAMTGREVANATSVSFSTWRPDTTPDLEPYVPNTVRSLLHIPCGDGTFGERIRKRQKCRVVGIEPDKRAAAIARRHLDDVYTNDIEEVISILEDRFECIVATGIIEHFLDPWSLAASLRRISAPGGLLIASVPNLSNARTIQDLVAGNFSVGHQVRYFTRASIAELLEISGWTVETIDPVAEPDRRSEPLFDSLRSAGFATSDDLFVTRFNVVARNQGE
jgi:2-polyprenyl-3-methyl-5-hydroxy-6-metoxy-1,4-benzoquinol methylase